MPTRMAAAQASGREVQSRAIGWPALAATPMAAPAPSAMPANPPSVDRRAASVTNCMRMLPGVAPSARLRPISPRRSITVTIIMLAMLMPPTASAITPIIRPSVVSESLVVLRALDRSADAVTDTLPPAGLAAWASVRRVPSASPGVVRT